MEQNNKTKEILTEQAIIHLRECYAHAITLTKTVVTLNAVTLGAGGLFLRFGKIPSLATNELTTKLFIISGCLVALFGIVFNQGASVVHSNLYIKGKNLINFIKAEVNGELYKDFFSSVADNEKGVSYFLTKLFGCGSFRTTLFNGFGGMVSRVI